MISTPHTPSDVTPELASAQVAALLNAVCGPNVGLRRQIEELIHDSTFSKVAEEMSTATGQIASSLDLQKADGVDAKWETLLEGEKPGSVIGRYTLVEQLGEGGMGTVFLAEQKEPVQRQVALKIIKPGMDSKEVVARFAAERQALAVMDHPNIAKVFDGGLTPSGRPYFVMELVRGTPLAKYCDEQRLTLRQRLELFLVICRALQHAHQKGVIHRDLKPSNILVSRDAQRSGVKVIDFGLAKALREKLTEQTIETEFGRLVGTLEYMSPEQATLDQTLVDIRSDVYSLGVILHELLVGCRPFSRKDYPKANLAELLHQLQTFEPMAPSVRFNQQEPSRQLEIAAARGTVPERLKRDVTGELDWIVLKALAREPNDRYPTAVSLADEIEHYLKDEPVEASPPSLRYRVGKFVRRNRGPVLAASLLAIALLAGVAGTTWGWLRSLDKEREAVKARDDEQKQKQEAEKQRDAAQTAEKEAKEQAQIATAVNRFLLNDLLGEAEPEKNPRYRKVTVETLVDRAAQRLPLAFKDQPHLEAALRQTVGEVYRVLGNLTASRPQLERSNELRQQLLPPDHPDRLRTLFSLAVLAWAQAKYDESAARHLELLDLLRQAKNVDVRILLEVKGSLGNVYVSQAKFDLAEPLFQEVLEGWEQHGGPQHPETMAALNHLGLLRWRQKRYPEAQAFLERAKLIADTLGYDYPTSLNVIGNLGLVLRFQGKYAEAEKLYLQAWEGRRRVLGDEHQETLITASNLGMLWGILKRFGEAEKLLSETVEGCRKHLGEQHPQTIKTVNNLACVYSDQNQPAKAFELLDSVFALSLEVYSADEPDLWNVLRNYEANGYVAKQYAKIEPAQRKLLELEHAKPNPDPKVLAAVAGRLAEHLFREKRYEEALGPLEETCRLRAQVAPNSGTTQDMRVRYGICLNEAKRYAEAIPPLEAAAAVMSKQANLNAAGKEALRRAYQELVRAYQGCGKSTDAEKWQAVLAEYQKTAVRPAATKP